MSSLESVWTFREETLYPQLFGTLSRGRFPIEANTYARLAPVDIAPHWLELGVLEYAPTEARRSWLYVTSGGSTPWGIEPARYDREAFSGLGVEYVLETPESAEWPVHVLKWLLARHVLAAHRLLGEAPLPDFGGVLDLGMPMDGANSALRHVALCLPTHYPSEGQLDSGKFDFLHALGITDSERNYAQSSGTARMALRLAEKGAAPVTDARRAAHRL